MPNLLVLLIILLHCSPLALDRYPHLLIVWNVGQGQWITYKDPQGFCWHIDSGGEFFPKASITNLCRRQNYLQFTHSDRDHNRFRWWIQNNLSWSQKKSQHLASSKITHPKAHPLKNLSVLYSVKNWILIPGDNSIAAENLWLEQKTNWNLSLFRILILGHHGSRTSTGLHFLKKLDNLKLAIASSRFARHRHPHPETRSRLQKNKTPMLTTEQWGSVWIEIPSKD
ncbi:MAG: hypothetical protein ACLGGX_04015 [Bdellovibrionia bacterium]